MVAVTYGTHRIPTTKTAERAKAAAPRKSLFARFMDALVESRLQSVHREISRHAHLLVVHVGRTRKSVDQYRRQDAVQRLTTAALPAKPPRCPRPGRFCFCYLGSDSAAASRA